MKIKYYENDLPENLDLGSIVAIDTETMGYVGKNLIRSFVKKGYKIIIPYQRQIDEADLRLLGSVGQIIPFHFSTLENPKLLSILKNADICINLKTTWDSKESHLEKSIYTFNKELTEAIKQSSSIKKS